MLNGKKGYITAPFQYYTRKSMSTVRSNTLLVNLYTNVPLQADVGVFAKTITGEEDRVPIFFAEIKGADALKHPSTRNAADAQMRAR